MSDLSKEFVLNIIDAYEDTIAFYKDILAENEKILKSDCSDKRKEAAQLLVDVSKDEIEKCQDEIRRLLCEN